MPANNRLVWFLAAAIGLTVAGCGGSPHNPTPQGGFTNASLNGTFAFSFSGTDSAGFFAAAGSLTADGSGRITSGVLDENKVGGVLSNVPISGTYNIRADGRGVASINSSAENFSMVFVIGSPQHVLLTRFENSATGSGSMDLQNPAAFSTAALAGTFVFNLAGVDTTANPFATVGSISTDTTGTVTGGVQDSADNGAIFVNEAISAGNIAVGTNGRGTASLTTVAGPLNFAFYVVDANRIKLVETDPSQALAGDAFRQTSPASNGDVSGPFAFTIAGSTATGGPFAAGGVFAADGAGNIPSGTEDLNDGGLVNANLGLTGVYSIAANGRGTATLSSSGGTFTFAAYPTTNGVQLLETDTGAVVSGGAFSQTGTLSSASLQGTYGLNQTGVTVNGPFDSVASLTATGSGHMSGIVDVNNTGVLSTGTALTVSYSVDATGRGPLTFASSILGQQNMAVYVVNGNRALFVELDNNSVAIGELQHQ